MYVVPILYKDRRFLGLGWEVVGGRHDKENSQTHPQSSLLTATPVGVEPL